ncbi:uncharacterized protein LOC130998367 [Salvia miltiorrhiza]|uniref:uncharacterized protein LOC130998367 n=1 Tax=Salvia miltiorrhiza TaxID=226208 RepID=UPI0025ACCDB3|nr:uncharacterized protein LOC130998367 [Salvia miltiorrhiza]
MSEKGKNEVIELDHFFHKHPLILTERAGRTEYDLCSGCWRYIFSGETIYRCRDCSSPTLHEECAEMPREITLSLHPQHTLVQKESRRRSCSVCGKGIRGIGYYCSSSGSCQFQIHLGCARSMDVMGAAAAGNQHPSHPQHELKLLWRPGRAASLRCDACSTIHRGNSYLCTVCQYSINESCAALPATLDHHLHGHPLSLAYCLPLDYIKWNFKCDVCFKDLLRKYWVYHCEICRYVAHINCAITTSPVIMSNIDVDAVDGDVIAFPINDAVELIGRFVTRLGVTVISHDNEIVKGKYKLHNPDHQLHLISSSRLEEEEEEEGDNSDDEDDDDLNYGLKSTLVCDGCTGPILEKKQKSGSSSSNKYISCGECKYSLHLPCFQSPTELSSHPLHPEPDHILTLQTGPKLNFVYCSFCRFYTNGLFYECKMCNFKVDIKCISLPDTIKHAAHPHHHLKLLTKEITRNSGFWLRACSACGYDTFADVCYRCDG